MLPDVEPKENGLRRVPRGEVGLIFAQMGLATAALGAGVCCKRESSDMTGKSIT